MFNFLKKLLGIEEQPVIEQQVVEEVKVKKVKKPRAKKEAVAEPVVPRKRGRKPAAK